MLCKINLLSSHSVNVPILTTVLTLAWFLGGSLKRAEHNQHSYLQILTGSKAETNMNYPYFVAFFPKSEIFSKNTF